MRAETVIKLNRKKPRWKAGEEDVMESSLSGDKSRRRQRWKNHHFPNGSYKPEEIGDRNKKTAGKFSFSERYEGDKKNRVREKTLSLTREKPTFPNSVKTIIFPLIKLIIPRRRKNSIGGNYLPCFLSMLTYKIWGSHILVTRTCVHRSYMFWKYIDMCFFFVTYIDMCSFQSLY